MANLSNYDKMNNILQKIKARKGKWQFTLLFFFLALIFILGFISPKIIESKKNNWVEERNLFVRKIKDDATDKFKLKQTELISVTDNLKNDLRSILLGAYDSEKLFDALNGNYQPYSLSLFNPVDELIAWNDLVFFQQEDLQRTYYSIGSTFFFNAQLVTFLGVVDTIIVGEESYKIFTGLPIHSVANNLSKKFKLRNFDEVLSAEFDTDINFLFEPYKSKFTNSNEMGFELINNREDKIGLLVVGFPSLQSEINNIREKFGTAQSILIILSYLLLGFSLLKDYKSFNSLAIKFLLLLLYLVVGRIILFSTNTPNIILPEYLSDPNLFSSKFGEGIVRSPVDFFVTTFFFFLISLQAFLKSRVFFNDTTKSYSSNKYKSFLATVILAVIITLSIRAFAAICKSVIFDSTLRYFKEPELFPPIAHIAMLGTLLLCGTAFILIMISILFFGSKIFSLQKFSKLNLFFSVIVFSGIYFIQNEPLLPFHFYLIFFLLILFLFLRQLGNTFKSSFQFGIYLFASSFISTIYINYFNGELERSSLVSTALELERSNNSFYNFLMNESIESLKDDELISSAFLRQENQIYSTCFIALQNLKLSEQTTAYSISLLDRSRKILGSFSHGMSNPDFYASFFMNIKIEDSIIKEVIAPDGAMYLTGIAPIKDRNIILGYVNLTIKLENRLFRNDSESKLFSTAIDKPSDIINPRLLNITLVAENKIELLQGTIIPDREVINKVVDHSFNSSNEYWVESVKDGDSYVTLAYKSVEGNYRVFYLITLKENNLTLVLFNFFKIFITHSFLILIFYLVAISFNIKNFLELFLTFRTKLLAALILISLIPIIALAAYNRIDSSEKIIEQYRTSLREKILLVERHIHNQLIRNPERKLDVALQKASEELETNFSVFTNSTLSFSSYRQYYQASLISDRLLPSAFIELKLSDGKQFFHIDSEGEYYAFYQKSNFNNEEIVFVVDDVFNRIQTVFSPIEVDVFLVGVYSFAIVLILVISTFISNTISTPIRKLTRATQSVAMGDLNFELQTSETGEMRDLISGFNYMTNELKKSQREISQLERENAWREMAKQIAHEIKNPLTPMKLTIQQLITAYKDKSAKFDSIFEKVSTTILNQIEILNQIASEFSRFARMPSLTLEKINLNELLQEIKTLFEDENLSIQLNFKNDMVVIEGDHSQTRRMFVNLCRNSIQADANKIIINIFIDGDSKIVELIDNGSGISFEDQKNIFAHNFTSKPSGMGLGLKLAKRYMESIDGSIDLVHSEKGNTTFRVSFK